MFGVVCGLVWHGLGVVGFFVGCFFSIKYMGIVNILDFL